jgi:hypothetical protein
MADVQLSSTEWFVEAGLTFLVTVAVIVTRQYRGLHPHKVQELMAAIQDIGYATNSIITVQLKKGIYYLVDGLHRVSAVRQCIKLGSLSPTFQVKAVVLREDTPSWYVIAYSAKVNEAHKTVALATTTDKLRWYAMYITSLAPDYKSKDSRNTAKTKKQAAPTWVDVTPEYATNKMKVAGKSPDGFGYSSVEKLSGLLKAIREPQLTDEEVYPALTHISSAYTDLMVMDQLGQIGVGALFNCFSFSWPRGEPPGPKTPIVPPKFKLDHPKKWYNINVIEFYVLS